MPDPLSRNPDRLLPIASEARAIARGLYQSIADKPIVSPHGHVPATLLADDEAFADPASLFVTPDHYITRLLHANGADLRDLGLGDAEVGPSTARMIWRRLAAGADALRGTVAGYWLEEQLRDVLGIELRLSPETADSVFDAVSERLRRPEFRPRALFDRFRIDVLATTDDPMDDLEAHAVLARSDWGGRVIPTFRPDPYIDAESDGFVELVDKLLGATGSRADFAGFLAALASRREYFIRHGAVSADHGVEQPYTVDLEPMEAERLFARILSGRADAQDRRTFRGHMLFQAARMSIDDGLVMTVHAGVRRNHHEATRLAFGPDSGHDIPVATEFTRNLQPLLNRFGTEPGFHLVLFTVDETTYSRELAPLAGFYPAVYIGAPWWFLDSPESIARFRASVTDIVGFHRGSGFVDDTRAFLSIPVRHDMSRRADASFLAELVVRGRLTVEDAEKVIVDLVDGLPRRVFKL